MSRAFSVAVAAATGASVLAIAPAAFAAAPNISGVSPAATVGVGAGQNGHPARQIVITVSNVATSDTVTVTFPAFTGLSATVTNVDGTAHTVTANVSTSATSAPSSGFNLTLTDVTTSSSDTTPFAIVAAPALSSASPSRLLVGTTTSVTLTGTGLQSGVVASASAQSQVTFGAVTVGSGGTSGTVSVTVGNSAPGGPVAVTLTNPDGGWSTQSGAINVDTFVVSDISPATASNADSNTAVPLTVTGQGIPSGNTTLRLTPTFAVTGQDPIVVNPTSIAANGQTWQGNANLAAVAPGTYQVQLVNGSNTGTLASKNFTVTAVGAPTVTAITPNSVGQGSDVTLALTGTNFARGSTVTFTKSGFTAGTVTFTSSTQISVPVHVAANAGTGSANATQVIVKNTGPTPNANTTSPLVTVVPPPTISSVSPSTLGQGASTTLTITGTGFQSGATVTFATGITATGTATISSTQIKIAVKVASNSPNKVDVTVKNADNGTAKTTLTINAFTVTSVSPHYVPNTFNGTLTVNGSGFATGATVSFPSGAGVSVQGGKSATVAANGQSLTVPIVVSRTTAATVDVTVTNTTTDQGTATCSACLAVAVAPSPPANAAASKSGTTATVRWDAIVAPNDGGAPITGYTVTVTSPSGSGIPAQNLSASTTTATFSNLDANTDYVFAVTATNAANLTSAASSATTSRKSSLTLHAQHSRTVSGQADTLSGRLLDVHGNPIAGAVVVVHRRSDTGVSGVLATLTTDATGSWSATPKPLTNTTFFATYAGDANNDASTSPSTRVVVAARVSIHGVLSATSDVITITGRVAPNKAGQTVRLVGFDRNGNLHRFGAKTLDGNSHYRFRMKLPAGRWRFQVRIGQTTGNASGQSANLVAQG